MRSLFLACCFGIVSGAIAAPAFLDDQFELPEGFRIYRAATREQSGGSYALRFDGQGRLLVGDGTALRRLKDDDGDGVFDGFEIIATGLGRRGPQGILVYGDRLFAVGGDGIQLYEGYSSDGPLRHVGRIGEKFGTGGDHDAHTLLRGHDGYIYFMAGNGSGLKDRMHITEENSPALREREASVFRISPDGKKWECIATGGRNPPSLGMNYLGDLFSFDSDMEWHVALPFYRPVRLNHWVIGGDQGWQDVGAYPPYYIDNLPGILDVGRGSPDWGIFYEHDQFPDKYRNAFLVCDYRWKGAGSGDYETSGRLAAFFLERSESRWKATTETFAKPKAGAKDESGRPIAFALVDVDVAPDGSIYLTDHNQGIWRILYDPAKKIAGGPKFARRAGLKPVEELLSLPQPGSEMARLLEQQIARENPGIEQEALRIAKDGSAPLEQRIRAIRFLAPNLPAIANDLAKDSTVEIRAQAAWLAGLRGGDDLALLPKLLKDADPFVRRRAAEGLTRHASLKFLPDIQAALMDSDRTVRYTAMIALSHLPTKTWFDQSTNWSRPSQLRALTAAHLRKDRPAAEAVQKMVSGLIGTSPREGQLDFLRVLGLYRDEVGRGDAVVSWVRRDFPTGDPDIDWERARVLAAFGDSLAFPHLLKALREATDPVRQFHYFQCIAKLKSGWTTQNEKQLLDWALATQQGWFAEFGEKGVEFPSFLQAALDEFASNHSQLVLAASERIRLESLLGAGYLGLVADREPVRLIELYRARAEEAPRVAILKAMARARTAETAAFLRNELKATPPPALRRAALASLRAMPPSSENIPFLRETFVPANRRERTDQEIHEAIMAATFDKGDAGAGRAIYERLLCNSCHAGGKTPGQEGRIFGPDLVGVTARLTRLELADSLAFPSKQVADRFKAMELTLKDGRELTGFVTEKTDAQVTFADASAVHRVPVGDIEKLAPQEKSLMPDGLLRGLSDQEIASLLRFISELGAK